VTTEIQARKNWDEASLNYDKRTLLIDWIYTKERRIFTALKGKILEIGTGTGKNLSFYNSKAEVTASDWSTRMVRQARIRKRRLKLENIQKVMVADILSLSQYFEPNSFNYVTSTCVFCSVPNPVQGLREVLKILAPTGRLIQIEHGISDNWIVNGVLKMANKISYQMQRFSLIRNYIQNLQEAGFELIQQKPIDPLRIFRILISRPK